MHAEEFERHGYCVLSSIVKRVMQVIRERLLAADLVGSVYVAVQCTYFEKSAQQNWLVAFHQDLSIPVKERMPHPTLTGWSDKDGALFVQAPLSKATGSSRRRVLHFLFGPPDLPYGLNWPT